ncbi:calcitonin gene-related peptide type 1 receptor-like [Limulus polyphemus]|uniref:Calcitonin gene-related peptide type 1 receptor-like n=1 Tax=Limulus polyphemus TaxID=6850 RepID=A0ABM1SZ35_LIMPO|nr:calcitonin gene-related peptide type 1 receptor-like [Limulus polyphemus]XP_022248891.1 calcitonin gene-related peptide type 1 receptor-like [Limulus polyphemus]
MIWKKLIFLLTTVFPEAFSFRSRKNSMLKSIVFSSQDDTVDKELLHKQLKAYWMCRGSTTTIPTRFNMCPQTFDGWGCWEATPGGTVANIPCSSITNTHNTNNATWWCTPKHQWAKKAGKYLGDYSACSMKIVTDKHADTLARILHQMAYLEESPYASTAVKHIFETCVNDVLMRSQPKELYCHGVFDGWGCWNITKAGEVAFQPCPSFVPGFSPDRLAYKFCQKDGSWFQHPVTNKTWSNYTTCVDREDLKFRQRINNLYIGGYSVSVVALILSLIIFFYFKSLRCTRVTIHKNLFISFVVNNIMWIIWYIEVVQRPQVVLENGPACQVLHVIVRYFLVCNYLWMFCEGLYLHTLLVVAFVAEKKIMTWFYVLGWGTPMILIIVYTAVRSYQSRDTNFCWIEDSHYEWILSGPVCISMLLNFVFLINIVRVLVTKLRAVNSTDSHQIRKAVRATLILIPLLGLHYFVTPFRPEPRSPGEAVYEPISAIVTSFQGLSVAILFCFFNGEVMNILRRFVRQHLNVYHFDTPVQL